MLFLFIVLVVVFYHSSRKVIETHSHHFATLLALHITSKAGFYWPHQHLWTHSDYRDTPLKKKIVRPLAKVCSTFFLAFCTMLLVSLLLENKINGLRGKRSLEVQNFPPSSFRGRKSAKFSAVGYLEDSSKKVVSETRQQSGAWASSDMLSRGRYPLGVRADLGSSLPLSACFLE